MKKVLIYSILFLTSACCWRSPYSSFYMMNSQGLEKISDKQLSVAVQTVNVPDLLDRPQMVTYDTKSQKVNMLEFSRWGEALPAVLQNTITNDLMAYLPKSYVKSARYDTETLPYNVKVEVNKIEAYRGDKVKLSVWWNIQNSNGNVLKRRQSAYETKVKDNTIAELVKAENAAVHQLSKDIAQTLSKM